MYQVKNQSKYAQIEDESKSGQMFNEINKLYNTENFNLYTLEEVIYRCVNNGADVNYISKKSKFTILMYFLHFSYNLQDLSMIKFLIEKGADLNITAGKKSLFNLSLSHDVSILKYFVGNGLSNIDYTKYLIFEDIRVMYNLNMIKFFVHLKVDLNVIDEKGNTLFFYTDDIEVMTFLSEYGIDINHVNFKGESCIFSDCFDMTRIQNLLYLGANPNIRKFTGHSFFDIIHEIHRNTPFLKNIKKYISELNQLNIKPVKK
jgi:ankyrin repeat protein